MIHSLLTLLLAVTALTQSPASPVTAASAPVVKRFKAPEARQAVAVDEKFFYAITNAAIGKYDKSTGEKIAEWKDAPDGHIKHLNSGIVIGDELLCAHSNYPETPMVSSIEIFDTKTMRHLRTQALPSGYGSATWIDARDDVWWVTFAQYAGKGGEAGKGPELTQLVRFDRRWRKQAAWTFPEAVIARWAGMSSSGGAWGADGLLYTTGHDAKELYVVRLPKSGARLELVSIVPMESEGQGIALDRTAASDAQPQGPLYSIQRKTGEILVSTLPIIAPAAGAADSKQAASSSRSPRANVVIIYTDDLGYGDVSAYGATKLKTPNIDRLAASGLRFTDAHAAAATCTPSRYALLTGEYAWRKPGTGILPGNASLIVSPDRTTLPKLFQRAGYTTGVVGKWHLGLGASSTNGVAGPDWNGAIAPGPREVGFDASFIMAATGDRVPTVFVENGRVVGLDPADPIRVSYDAPIGDWPTGKANPGALKMTPSHGHDQTIVNGISRIGYMTGGKAALWKDEDMADVFTSRAVTFIEANRDKPFFLYFATHDPHVPRVPHPRFAGTSGLGPRGDAILEADWSVGEILKTLDRLKLSHDTLVIFSSDNGPVVDDGYRDEAVAKLNGHRPAGPFRGGKYSSFEGGTRVPFIVSWPGHVKPGVSDALISQVDFVASFGAWLKESPVQTESPDSENVLAALLGSSTRGRDTLVLQAGGLALRQGHWKYIEPAKGPARDENTNTELGNDPAPQLYDLAADPGETKNLAAAQPDRVAALRDALRRIRGPLVQ